MVIFLCRAAFIRSSLDGWEKLGMISNYFWRIGKPWQARSVSIAGPSSRAQLKHRDSTGCSVSNRPAPGGRNGWLSLFKTP